MMRDHTTSASPHIIKAITAGRGAACHGWCAGGKRKPSVSPTGNTDGVVLTIGRKASSRLKNAP
jgi:hypothetical protein